MGFDPLQHKAPQHWLWLLPALLAWWWVVCQLPGFEMIADEYVHYPRAVGFLHGDPSVHAQYTPMLPGYHMLAAAMLRVTGTESLFAVRALNVMLGAACVWMFLCIRRRLFDGDAVLPTAQLALLPILFPFVFLAYTDVLALAMALAALWATLCARHVGAGILLLLAVAVRQNSMLFAPFLAVVAVWPRLATTPPRRWLHEALPLWPYALPVVALAAYWWMHGTISAAPGLATLNPVGVHLGNLYFLLFLAAMLLPGHVIAGLREFVAAAKLQKKLWAIPVLLLAAFWFGFETRHPLNAHAASGHEMFLRARLFKAMAESDALRLAFGMIACAAACGLYTTSLKPLGAQRFWWAFALVFLCTQWLVEPRYVLLPAVTWLAMRETRVPALERATLLWWVTLSVSLFAAILTRQHFP